MQAKLNEDNCMNKRHLVFICHANPEDNEFASWLGTRLTAAGYEAWADVLNLLGGETFWRDIGNAIKEEAAVVVVALSHASYQKDGVLDEIALAVNTGRQHGKELFIIPIRLLTQLGGRIQQAPEEFQ